MAIGTAAKARVRPFQPAALSEAHLGFLVSARDKTIPVAHRGWRHRRET